jgi:hypothetical protein
MNSVRTSVWGPTGPEGQGNDVSIFSREFVVSSAERAIKTSAQAAVACIGSSAVIASVDWAIVWSTVVAATILSLLTSIASHEVSGAGPSLTGTERLEAKSA